MRSDYGRRYTTLADRNRLWNFVGNGRHRSIRLSQMCTAKSRLCQCDDAGSADDRHGSGTEIHFYRLTKFVRLCVPFPIEPFCRLSKLHRYARLCDTDSVGGEDRRSRIRARSIVHYRWHLADGMIRLDIRVLLGVTRF